MLKAKKANSWGSNKFWHLANNLRPSYVTALSYFLCPGCGSRTFAWLWGPGWSRKAKWTYYICSDALDCPTIVALRVWDLLSYLLAATLCVFRLCAACFAAPWQSFLFLYDAVWPQICVNRWLNLSAVMCLIDLFHPWCRLLSLKDHLWVRTFTAQSVCLAKQGINIEANGEKKKTQKLFILY